jgi:hypothetical protein
MQSCGKSSIKFLDLGCLLSGVCDNTHVDARETKHRSKTMTTTTRNTLATIYNIACVVACCCCPVLLFVLSPVQYRD